MCSVHLLIKMPLQRWKKKVSRRVLGKLWRHQLILLLQVPILLLSQPTGFAQTKSIENLFDLPLPKNIYLSEQDLTDTINCFKTEDAKKSVETFQTKMPPNVTDTKFRDEVLQRIPQSIKNLGINDPTVIENFRKIVVPVLGLYGKSKIYDIIIFQHPTPVMFSDSGVVIVVSTGMIERAASDDELLGFIAHEVAHEYYAKASVYTKYILGFVTTDDSDQALAKKYWESLSLIELQCDSFSALTLASLGYDPLAFIRGLEKVEGDFPQFGKGFHPAAGVRRKVVEAVISPQTLSAKARISPELRKLKEIFAAKRLSRSLENQD